MTILEKIVARGHLDFADSVPDWREAVRLGAEPLVRTGYVAPHYSDAIIASIEKYGPYMVYDHCVAMPHSQMNASGALKTAVSLLILRHSADFGIDIFGYRKTAKLIFTLSAADPDEHIDNIRDLMEVFTDYPLLDALMMARTPEDVLKAAAAKTK